MPGWGRLDWDAWEAMRAHLAGRVEWCAEMVAHDLDYWSDPIACRQQPRPSLRALARDYSWGVERVRRMVARHQRDTCETPARQTARHGGGFRTPSETPARHLRDTCETAPILNPPAMPAPEGPHVTRHTSHIGGGPSMEGAPAPPLPKAGEVPDVATLLERSGLVPSGVLITPAAAAEALRQCEALGEARFEAACRWLATSDAREATYQRGRALHLALRSLPDAVRLMGTGRRPPGGLSDATMRRLRAAGLVED